MLPALWLLAYLWRGYLFSFQMFLAAGAAIIARVNVPVSVALVWLTNPITIPPMFYGAYRLGAWVLDVPRRPFNFELSWDWLMDSLYTIGPSFLTGCFIIGTLSSIFRLPDCQYFVVGDRIQSRRYAINRSTIT